MIMHYNHDLLQVHIIVCVYILYGLEDRVQGKKVFLYNFLTLIYRLQPTAINCSHDHA